MGLKQKGSVEDYGEQFQESGVWIGRLCWQLSLMDY